MVQVHTNEDPQPSVTVTDESASDILSNRDVSQWLRRPTGLSVLKKAAFDALTVLPAERCIVFTYDRNANLLSPQVSSHLEDDSSEGHADEVAAGVSFPPVMGMISASFLQKRCLRMQEPNMHHPFYREYDVPKSMVVNSIICAPVILHHRVVAVMELLNRVDPVSVQPHDSQHPPGRSNSLLDNENDIKLRRTKMVKTGFSAKDEQKLIQLASHTAKTIEAKMKQRGNGETQEKQREVQAQSAIELLNMLNQTLERRINPESMLVQFTDNHNREPETESHHVLKQISEPSPMIVNIIDITIAIMKVQMAFRRRRVRKRKYLGKALEIYRVHQERANSAITLQRITRGWLVRRQKSKEKQAGTVLARGYKQYKTRASQHVTNRNFKQPVKPSSRWKQPTGARLMKGVDMFRVRSIGATSIQKHFRGHLVRKEIKRTFGFTNISKGLRNLVKIQAFVRGNLVRKKFQRIRKKQQSTPKPTIINMRIATSLTSNQLNQDNKSSFDRARIIQSRCCTYPLPGRQSKGFLAQHRSVSPRCQLESLFGQSRSLTIHHKAVVEQSTSIGLETSAPNGFDIESRRLATVVKHQEQPRHRIYQSLQDAQSVSASSKPMPAFILDIAINKKGNNSPPGVEFVPATKNNTLRHPQTCIQPPGTINLHTHNKSYELFRRQAFESAVEIRNPTTAGSTSTLTLPRLPLEQQRRRPNNGGALLCCLLPASPKPQHSIHRESIMSLVSYPFPPK